MKIVKPIVLLLAALNIIGCDANTQKNEMEKVPKKEEMLTPVRTEIYAKVKLTTATENLNDENKKVLKILIEAAQEMDKIFWKQANPDNLEINLSNLDANTLLFYKINYGPWDRLENNLPF